MVGPGNTRFPVGQMSIASLRCGKLKECWVSEVIPSKPSHPILPWYHVRSSETPRLHSPSTAGREEKADNRQKQGQRQVRDRARGWLLFLMGCGKLCPNAGTSQFCSLHAGGVLTTAGDP